MRPTQACAMAAITCTSETPRDVDNSPYAIGGVCELNSFTRSKQALPNPFTLEQEISKDSKNRSYVELKEKKYYLDFRVDFFPVTKILS